MGNYILDSDLDFSGDVRDAQGVKIPARSIFLEDTESDLFLRDGEIVEYIQKLEVKLIEMADWFEEDTRRISLEIFEEKTKDYVEMRLLIKRIVREFSLITVYSGTWKQKYRLCPLCKEMVVSGEIQNSHKDDCIWKRAKELNDAAKT
jgi:hypothetical protein